VSLSDALTYLSIIMIFFSRMTHNLRRYPVTRQGTPADYDNYPLLCEAIRNAFNEAGQKDWLITVATTINPDSLKKGYDMVNMAPHIDWFNMMSYDIHGSWDARAGVL
jgi:chitinase